MTGSQLPAVTRTAGASGTAGNGVCEPGQGDLLEVPGGWLWESTWLPGRREEKRVLAVDAGAAGGRPPPDRIGSRVWALGTAAPKGTLRGLGNARLWH